MKARLRQAIWTVARASLLAAGALTRAGAAVIAAIAVLLMALGLMGITLAVMECGRRISSSAYVPGILLGAGAFAGTVGACIVSLLLAASALFVNRIGHETQKAARALAPFGAPALSDPELDLLRRSGEPLDAASLLHAAVTSGGPEKQLLTAHADEVNGPLPSDPRTMPPVI